MSRLLRRSAAIVALALALLAAGTSGCSDASTSTAAASASDRAEITVYVTRTGKKYHRDGCRHLSRSRIPTPLSEARSSYGPCSVCDPER